MITHKIIGILLIIGSFFLFSGKSDNRILKNINSVFIRVIGGVFIVFAFALITMLALDISFT
jgi:hypothetical protein